MTVPDSRATRVTVPRNYNHYGICPNYPYFLSQPPVALIYHIFCFSLSYEANSRQKKTIGDFCAFGLVFGEPIGLDLYCLLSHLDPNESLGIKIDQHRGQFHDSGLCMTSRHTRRNAQGELVTFTNQELAWLERTNRQQPRQTDTTMGDHANQDDLAAAMALMQQQMQQMQQTIQAQQDAAEQAALAQQEQQAQTKIDELTTKVDQLLKNNQGHVFNMEQATAGHIQNQNKRQPQSNQQAGQQVQAKALNQVTTEIDTRMGNMFTELNNKYDNLAIHIKKIDVQLAQTAESVKRQQETLPGRTDKNPRTEHCNAIEQPFAETAPGAEERAEQSASSGVTAPSELAETPPSRVYVPKVPYPIPPKHLMDPISEEQLIGFNKMLKVVPEKEHGDKGESRLFSDEDSSTDPTEIRGNSRVKQKVQKKRVKGDPTMTLIPLKCDGNSIEYEVKCKGTSKPFSKVRAIITHELKEKGKVAVKGLLSRGWRTRMNAKSEPPVALRTIMYYLLLRHITISVFKKKKKNEINVMEKGKKEKKHGATGKVEQEVWSCIGWEMDQLEQKRQKTMQFGSFHAEQS
ncbi:hypothetical protein IGI04_025996 [Brassica rapa subsp. trilocularis]|uniref:Uncharacterized protein n=1 Tax=Brassica rapa subsp. trilocularis TaxID=1813537 RepID=A0ABQ7KV18_BRACM|nr:hypothetical protein IGI04_025996 [Brassica rapa subsp. trilocularis]